MVSTGSQAEMRNAATSVKMGARVREGFVMGLVRLVSWKWSNLTVVMFNTGLSRKPMLFVVNTKSCCVHDDNPRILPRTVTALRVIKK